MARVTIEGLEKVLSKLDKLKKGIRNKILRKTLNKATQPVARSAKDLVPVDTGLLKKSIGRKIKRYKDSVVGIIGPRTGFGDEINGVKKDPVRYGWLVEYGTSHTPPRPFMRNTWDRTQGEVANIMRTEIEAGIKREVS